MGIGLAQAYTYQNEMLECKDSSLSSLYPYSLVSLGYIDISISQNCLLFVDILEYPPQMMNRGKPMPGMRPPPPGARGESHNAEASKGGMGGGVMAMILPIYAVGIVIYLLYTASKVWHIIQHQQVKSADRVAYGL